MHEKRNVIDLVPSSSGENKTQQVQLDSGRQIVIHSGEHEELLEIMETQGDVVLEVRLTDAGPIISLQGAQLAVKSTEAITLESKKISIKADEELGIESGGSLTIDSSKETDIHSDDEIRVEGKMIHLN